jgi:hypothetical protein
MKEPKPEIDIPREPKQWTDSNTKEKTLVKSKQKTKTKGASSEVQEAATITEMPTQEIDKQPIFKVNKSTFKVFTLFFSPGLSSLPGEIPWVEFLKAMSRIGFATQKLYGSI